MLQPTTVDSDELDHIYIVDASHVPIAPWCPFHQDDGPAARGSPCNSDNGAWLCENTDFFGWIQTPETNEVGFDVF